MQDPILKTSNMYDSAQTNIINIFAGKRGGGRDLFMHIERGREQGKDRPGTAISHLYIVSRQLRLTRVYCVQIRNWSSVY